MDRYTLIVAMTVSSARWQRRFGDPLARTQTAVHGEVPVSVFQ